VHLGVECLISGFGHHGDERGLAVLFAGGKPPPATFGLPQGLIAVSLDQWRAELSLRGIIPKDHKNPREAFRQIRESLEARALAAERDGLIWKV
jgi:hypothetical protein